MAASALARGRAADDARPPPDAGRDLRSRRLHHVAAGGAARMTFRRATPSCPAAPAAMAERRAGHARYRQGIDRPRRCSARTVGGPPENRRPGICPGMPEGAFMLASATTARRVCVLFALALWAAGRARPVAATRRRPPRAPAAQAVEILMGCRASDACLDPGYALAIRKLARQGGARVENEQGAASSAERLRPGDLPR